MRKFFKQAGVYLCAMALVCAIAVTVFFVGATIREETIRLPEGLEINLEIPPNTVVWPSSTIDRVYPPDAKKTRLPKDEFMKFVSSLPETEIGFLRYYTEKAGPLEKFTIYYWAPLGDGSIYYTELDISTRWGSKFEMERVTQVGETLFVSPRYRGVVSELRSFL